MKKYISWFGGSLILNLFSLVSIYGLSIANSRLLIGDILTGYVLQNRFIKLGLFIILFFSFLRFLSLLPLTYRLSIGIKNKEHRFSLNKCVGKLYVILVIIKLTLIGGTIFFLFSIPNDSSEKIPSEFRTIAHAMGGIDDIAYTNSLDAFEENYNNGARYFEIDVSITKDNQLVLWHDWGYSPNGVYNLDNIPTKQEFLEIDSLGKYQPLAVEDLRYILKRYNDVYFITDTKEQSLELVRQQFEYMVTLFLDEELEHFIPQFYTEEMYFEIDSIYHFMSYIFTVYQIWEGVTDDVIDYCRFCINNNIDYLTMPYTVYDLHGDKVIDITNDYNVKVWLHTVNDISDARWYFSNGVRGIYTDFLNNKDI